MTYLKRSRVRLLEVTVTAQRPTLWKWHTSEHDLEIMHGYETSRETAERIENVTDEIEALARGDASCRQLMTVPGIGPIIASAMVAAIGNGIAFARGRDFAAWLSLVPKQMSTGDRTILGRITKRGNRYLCTLFMQGARVILLRPVNWAKHSFGLWLTAAAQRLHHNVLATALANKLARIAWTVLAQGRSYEARVEPKVA